MSNPLFNALGGGKMPGAMGQFQQMMQQFQQFRANFQGDPKSLSARRAWIEIKLLRRALQGEQVALRKESVDRNFDICKARAIVARSLSARRAWIEIPCLWL